MRKEMMRNPWKYQGGWAWLAYAIPAAANFLSGMLNRDSQEKQMEENTRLQREFAQKGIQWRVEDAQKAGVSPLYALGGAGATYSPNPITVNPMAEAVRDMGQNVGQAIAARKTPEQLMAERLELEAAAQRVKTDAALEAKYRSDAAVNAQRMQSTMGGVGGTVQVGSLGNPVPSDSRNSGWVDLKPMEQDIRASSDSSAGAAVNPAWSRVEVAPGKFMWMPTERVNQQVQDLPLLFQIMSVMKNIGDNPNKPRPWYVGPTVKGKIRR